MITPIYDIVFHSFAVRNTASFAEAVFARPQGMIPEWEIFARLANRLTDKNDLGPAPVDQLAQILARGYHPKAAALDELKRCEGSVDLGPLVPSLKERLETPNARLVLAPEVFLADLPRLLAHELPTDHPFVMVGRRQVRSHNSWTQNANRLVKGRNRCAVQINATDAAALGILDDSPVRVSSRTGAVILPAEVTDDMAPGVVSIPQGWGQQSGQAAVAKATPTVSINDLTDDARVDPLTGNAAYNGVPVKLEPVSVTVE